MFAFVIAGTQSGVGKTTITLGILAALRKRGLQVQSFKVGPDFIDPGHHTAITGLPACTLDGWMLSREYNTQTFFHNLAGKDGGVVEGMMGLFDGYDGKTESGSTAEMAKWLGLPVILVVDASAMARSVAALIHGFQNFDPGLKVTGVIFNRIAGAAHLQYLREALESVPGMTLLGGLPTERAIAMPERHLGLVTQEEYILTPERIDQLAVITETHLDLDALLQHSVAPPSFSLPEPPQPTTGKAVRFGIAKDEAFCFYYPDNLTLLEQAGAELIFFSPLRDSHLPANLQGIYLGGGYPEVHAERLATNTSMREELRCFIEQGGVVYAECGGLMYLTQAIRTVEGRDFPMVGIFPATARMLPRLCALGYTEVDAPHSNPVLPTGRIRGHEFHYSQLERQPSFGEKISYVYNVRKRVADDPKAEGFLYKRCLASYIHLHFGSNPQVATSLVAAARQT